MSILALFFPMASVRWEFSGSDMDVYYWIWGFFYGVGTESYVFMSKFSLEIYGFVLGILIITTSVLIVFNGNKVRQGKSGGTIVLILGIIILLSLFAWILVIELKYAGSIKVFGESLNLNFWDFFEFSYGTYLLFIGGNTTIVGALVKMIS